MSEGINPFEITAGTCRVSTVTLTLLSGAGARMEVCPQTC